MTVSTESSDVCDSQGMLVSRVLDVIEEACPDFKVNKGHEVRVKSNLHDLREKGKITRKPAREKQWITSNVVFEMLTAMFKDAITKETPS
ncbi:hypothetical protein VTO58DRAFT_104016 [Aureobasidium pullulans]